jgi:hypothetical protein
MASYWERLQRRDGNPIRTAEAAEQRREQAAVEAGLVDLAGLPRKRKRDLVARMTMAAKPTRDDLELRAADVLPPRRS